MLIAEHEHEILQRSVDMNGRCRVGRIIPNQIPGESVPLYRKRDNETKVDSYSVVRAPSVTDLAVVGHVFTQPRKGTVPLHRLTSIPGYFSFSSPYTKYATDLAPIDMSQFKSEILCYIFPPYE